MTGWKRDWRTERGCLESAGSKVSGSKTEHLPPPNDDKGTKLKVAREAKRAPDYMNI